jgi:hypothetical protein
MQPTIYNVHENECIGYACQKIQLYNNLYRKPEQQLDTYRKLCAKAGLDIIFIQPPYFDYTAKQRYNDWSIFSPTHNIDIRYEVKSLNVNDSILCEQAERHVKESKHIREKLLVLILIGRGYDRIIKYSLEPMIAKKKLPVLILRTIEEYKAHLDEQFK